MKRISNRWINLAVITLLLAALVFVLIDQPGAASQFAQETDSNSATGSGNISSLAISPLSSVDSKPWTRERMLAAQPYPLAPISGELEYSLQFDQPAGEPEFVAGSPPAADTLQASTPISAQSTSLAAASGYEYPAPFARYQNFDSHTTYPYSAVGVLFFSQYGADYRCSAAAIGNYAVWTAGHCTHAGDGKQSGWSYDMVFVPGYKNGSTPFGVWQADYVTTKNLWFEFGDLRYDMGGAVFRLNAGQRLSDVVGRLGFAYNLENGLHWLNLGYPSASPFDGQTQQICAGSFAYADTSMPSPSPVAMGCDMTRGSSGGPWIISFSGQAGGANYLNGNNSYRYTFHPKELFSPYFGEAAKILFDELFSGFPTN